MNILTLAVLVGYTRASVDMELSEYYYRIIKVASLESLQELFRDMAEARTTVYKRPKHLVFFEDIRIELKKAPCASKMIWRNILLVKKPEYDDSWINPT